MVVCCCTVKRLLMKCNPSTVTQVTGYQLRVAARGLLGSRHLVVKINGFQRYLRKLGRYFTPKRPQELPLRRSMSFDTIG